MSEITEKITLFHNLFLVCLVLCILCAVIAVVVFFVLDIRGVLGYLTGRRAKKQIQALQESNAASGRLMPRERTNMQYVAQEMKEDMGVRGAAVPGARKVENVVQPVEASPQMNSQEQQMDSTTLLSNTSAEQNTTVLSAYRDEQSVIVQESVEDGSTAMLKSSQMQVGSFAIEKEIIMIHTDEVI